ncbi:MULTISPECIES: tRNA lysidine(34) synthetase TilS [Thermus]|uniref:tRNA(Ile)-lysidine synthase n=1 Tax=Thermus brockianus TaxID=56956 RepID=A0ABN0PK91_THEBO|nr:tRNA lysidine(34) synthetase TilS [Thermus brockianus]BDG15709.1 tRNA(Ile)-lysidine synthase [Thermus brockianus]
MWLLPLEALFLERLKALAPEDPLVLAVSGGGDSVALAHLVHRLGRKGVVAHLDHALRPDSAEDLAFVHALAERLGFPFFAERVEVGRIAQERGENLEALAREVRYTFLHRVAKKVGAKAILTAHTLDDQAETVLLKLLQGTARGLGIREKEGLVVRPLLPFPREALRDYLRSLGEVWREDPTNQDPSWDRNYLRLRVFPLLLERFPRAREALDRFARAQEAEDATLEKEAKARLLPDPRFFVPAYRVAPLLHAPPALRRRVLRQVLEGLSLRPEARLIALLEGALTGKPATLPEGFLARRKGGTLFLIPPSPKLPLPPGFRPPEPGDYLEMPYGRKRLRDFLAEKGVPKELKGLWPVRAEGKRVVEVLGLYPLGEEERQMGLALAEAKEALAQGEVPVGAVLVVGERLYRAHNRVEAEGDPTAHAEMLLLRQAGKEARGGRMYVTLEPCLMCQHALNQAGVEVVYGAENLKEGALTRFGLRGKVLGGVREGECAKLLRDFFARLREGCRSG